MYIGAASSLWMVRAWKIGDLEEQTAGKSKTNHAGATDGFEKSSFGKRMVMWRRV
jgi:hypothetical protein